MSLEHSHGAGIKLTDKEQKILENGIERILKLTEGMDWQKFPSEKHPLPLVQMRYQEIPTPDDVRKEILKRYKSDPVSILEDVLALVELYVSNQTYANEMFFEDMPFIRRHCFAVKRLNGWLVTHDYGDHEKIEKAVSSPINWTE